MFFGILNNSIVCTKEVAEQPLAHRLGYSGAFFGGVFIQPFSLFGGFRCAPPAG
jgi:hypothetical protein